MSSRRLCVIVVFEALLGLAIFIAPTDPLMAILSFPILAVVLAGFVEKHWR